MSEILIIMTQIGGQKLPTLATTAAQSFSSSRGSACRLAGWLAGRPPGRPAGCLAWPAGWLGRHAAADSLSFRRETSGCRGDLS